MLKHFDPNSDFIYIVERHNGKHTISLEDSFRSNILPNVSLNAINYFAFKLPTTEFLDELYGRFQEIVTNNKSSLREEDIVKELTRRQVTTSMTWTRNTKNLKSYPVQTCVYIRNYIHHPENKFNKAYSQMELQRAIQELISAIGFNDQQP